MINPRYLNIVIGLLIGILIGTIFLLAPLRSTPSDPRGFVLLLFAGGFIAGLFMRGPISEGALRGAISGVISGIFWFTSVSPYAEITPGIPIGIVAEGLIISILLALTNAIYGIAGIAVRNFIGNIVFGEYAMESFNARDLIPVVGICIGASITIIAIPLGRLSGLGIISLFAGTLLFFSPIIGGIVAGALSRGGTLEGGFHAGLDSAIIVCLVLSPPVTWVLSGNESNFGLQMLVFVGISGIAIVVYPWFGLIGVFLINNAKILIKKDYA